MGKKLPNSSSTRCRLILSDKRGMAEFLIIEGIFARMIVVEGQAVDSIHGYLRTGEA